MLQNKRIPHRSARFSARAVRSLSVVFLLAAVSALAFLAGKPRSYASAETFQRTLKFTPVFLQTQGQGSKPQPPVKAGTATPGANLEAIQAAIKPVHTPGIEKIARALGLSPKQVGHRAFEDSEMGLETIGDLGGSGFPAVAVKWRPPTPGQSLPSEDKPHLYLLSWDGKSWQPSYLTAAMDALNVQVLPVTETSAPMFAVTLYSGLTAVPYPVIFQLRNHHATPIWDSRSKNSFYSGYNYGSIKFEKVASESFPVMVAAGFADPGLLVFPFSSEQSGRGFQEVTAYAWQNGAYIPVRTEYTHNRDYTLYRFISALHLHEYKTAYALIEPKEFLKTDKPTLKLFRKTIRKKWSEFIDDKIFQVPSGSAKGSDSHVFILRLSDKKMYVYHPTFTGGPKYLLTGLERTETAGRRSPKVPGAQQD